MNKPLVFTVLVSLALTGAAWAAGADQVLVLPFHTVGVSGATAQASREILVQDLRSRGVPLRDLRGEELEPGSDACHDPGCAAELGERFDAGRVLYASLLRLGEKIVITAGAVTSPAGSVIYNDNLSALTEEDLDTVMRRIAGGFSAGDSTSTPTFSTVTAGEAEEPRRRATRGGIELRGGFLFPAGGSYGGADHLTSLNLSYVRETKDFLVETTALLGLAWGEGNVEWTPIDVFMARVFGEGDVAPYLGAGVGIRVLNVKGQRQLSEWGYYDHPDQNSTTLSLDVGGGIMALRTFDMSLQLEVRYHYVAEDFEKIGRRGAHGLSISFGTGR